MIHRYVSCYRVWQRALPWKVYLWLNAQSPMRAQRVCILIPSCPNIFKFPRFLRIQMYCTVCVCNYYFLMFQSFAKVLNILRASRQQISQDAVLPGEERSIQPESSRCNIYKPHFQKSSVNATKIKISNMLTLYKALFNRHREIECHNLH